MLSRHQLALLADPAPDDGRHRAPPHDRPELTGRSAERELLDALLRGRARLPALLVGSGVGSGKTALLRATDDQARRAGRRVVWVTGAPAEADLPYPGLHQLLYCLRTDLDLGARPWAARARNELRAARPAEGPAGPTAQEKSVARLAAQGLTNKQIAVRLRLSDRTVSGHPYKVYPKLGATSRTGLRDALEIRAGWDADGTAD
ncbi:LuxR family transcriptional regulator [Micromonospora sp. HM134]|uniref:helix-turn-helix transcriptional regulator n=2 Tax=unclassified Micromonospora TaxID=2617518 RepID=UPI001F0F41BA|nr:LuxR family transcriptional regulator [Micromonospora sp. HM134]